MKTIQTPNNLEVLLHYHTTPQIHPRHDAPAVKSAVEMLLAEGLLQRDDRLYTTTDKGKFYLDHLLSRPFPVRTFSIPGGD